MGNTVQGMGEGEELGVSKSLANVKTRGKSPCSQRPHKLIGEVAVLLRFLHPCSKIHGVKNLRENR